MGDVTVSDAYKWDPKAGAWLRFDGRRHRRAIRSADLAALRSASPLESQPIASEALRKKALDQAVEDALLAGSTVMQRAEYSAILGQKKPIRHGTHIFLSIITAGLWLTPYLIIAVARGDIRYRLEVDHWGHVWPTTV